MDDFFSKLPSGDNTSSLEQYLTPCWAAEALTELFLNHLSSTGVTPKRIIEPSCGKGAFLNAIPSDLMAYGIEIDPALATVARATTNRDVFTDDFLSSSIPDADDHRPDTLIGNPPFRIGTVRSFLDRAATLIPEGGCCGFVLPAHTFQHTHTVLQWAKSWRIKQWMIPRDIFPGLSVPVLFASFQKDVSGISPAAMEGFALYEATQRIKDMPKALRSVLIHGVDDPRGGRKTTWRILVERVLKEAGGRAPLQEIYRAVEPLRHTDNPAWREKIRQVLQIGPFERDGDAWAIAA
jgi:site-specific DNA-methyltransferase (adenine-specific)